MNVKIYPANSIIPMRRSGALAASVLDYITDFVKPGIRTDELDKLCHDFIIAHNATPSPLGFHGYPKSICTSVNHVVCHGIPSDKKLMDGDIVNLDVTVNLDGWHGDSSRMFYVGNVNPKAKRLIQVTYDSMMLGIETVRPGSTVGDIGYAIQSYAEKLGFSVVRDYCGHGIGHSMHEAPNIPHYGQQNDGLILQEGMFFTVEPMINVGGYETKLSPFDGWTVSTKDRSLSAQFEHTIAVTSTGYEILTLSHKGYRYPPYDN